MSSAPQESRHGQLSDTVVGPAVAAAASTPGSTGGGLRVGAARVNVTPSATQLPERYTNARDPLFARAIAVRNGEQTALIVTVDAIAIPTGVWNEVTRRLEVEWGVPPENVLLAATHSHSAERADEGGYVDGIVRSAVAALHAVQPARMSVAAGRSYLNVNRNVMDAGTGVWREGPNPEGPSDKTVWLVSFQTHDGRPIAVYYTYAMHAVTNGMLDRISADYPGAASAYLEDALGDDAVAVFGSGAAGDQNPLYFHQTYELRSIRTAEYAARGLDIGNAMPPGGEGLDRADPRVAMLLDQQAQLSDSMGQLLAEEVLALNRGLTHWVADATISGGQRVVRCPGRHRTDEGRAGRPGTYEDAEDVAIRLSLLRIGDVHLAGVDGEVFTAIAQRLVAASPHPHTIVATLANGLADSGYIYSDEASGYQTFEVLSSRLQPGHAETAIVDGLLEMLEATRGV